MKHQEGTIIRNMLFVLLFVAVLFFCSTTLAEGALNHFSGDHSNCYVFTGVADGVVGNFKIMKNDMDVTKQFTSSSCGVSYNNTATWIEFFIIYDATATREKEYSDFPSNAHLYLVEYSYGGKQFKMIDNTQLSGVCGDNLTWSLDAAGKLSIIGTGNMYDKYDWYGAFSETGTFWNNDLVTSVYIENGVESIGAETFCSSSFTSIDFPNSIREIRSMAFESSALERITLPNSLERLDGNAFDSCRNLTTVNIPAGLSIIDDHPFQNCGSLTTINVSPDNTHFCSINNVLYTKDLSAIVRYPTANDNISFSIPDGVRIIRSGAFNYCKNLVTIEIPSSVETIAAWSFTYCSNLHILRFFGSAPIFEKKR